LKSILSLIFLINFLYSNQNDKITWLINDAPPFYISEGEFKNMGFGDLFQKMIIEDLSNYNHEIKKSALSRVIKNFQHKKNVCFSTWIYNTTPEYVITSIPNLYYEPLGIITRKENKKFFTQIPISLDDLMANEKFIFIQGMGRGYGLPLDEIVNKYKEKPNFKIRKSSKNITDAIFEMIKRKRVDYTIDYYSSLSYYNARNEKNNQLIFLPVEENYEKGVLGSIACSKSLWGEKVIEDINKSIVKLREKNEYKNTFSKWLVPKENSSNYWNNYKNLIENFK